MCSELAINNINQCVKLKNAVVCWDSIAKSLNCRSLLDIPSTKPLWIKRPLLLGPDHLRPNNVRQTKLGLL